MKLGIGNPAASDYATILHQFPDFNFAKLTRSTIPFVSYWRNYEQRIANLAHLLRIDLSPDGVLFFEYPVPSARPQYKPSFTDAMYVSKANCIALEAKWTEQPDRKISAWLKGRPWRMDVLKHWRSLIAKRVSISDDLLDLPYQFVHRTASVCSLETKRAFLVFEIFRCPAIKRSSDRFEGAVKQLASKVEFNDSLELWLHSVELTPTRTFEDLRQEGIDAKALPHRIRGALIAGDLFSVDRESAKRIAPA